MKTGTCPKCGKKIQWVSEHLRKQHGYERSSKFYKHWTKLDWNRYVPSPGKLRWDKKRR